MAIFMARGYKDAFHRNVARSLANYLSESTRTRLRTFVEEADYDHPELLDVLDTETVTAWGRSQAAIGTARYSQRWRRETFS